MKHRVCLGRFGIERGKFALRNGIRGGNRNGMRQPSLPPKAIRFAAALVAAGIAAALPLAFGQYPGRIDTQKKAGPILRAIAVLEWTGTAGKPSASRLIPIAVFDGENYQPGGLYLARPQPLALDSGTEYILQSAGVPQGLFDVNGSQQVQGSWLGFGVWRKIVAPPMRKLPQGKNLPQVVKDAGGGRPHFSNSSAGGQTGGSGSSSSPKAKTPSGQTPPADSNRPVLVRRTTPNSGGNDSSGNASNSSGNSGGQPSTGASAPAPASSSPDPDRPILRRRTTASADNAPSYLPGGPETAILSADPNRPHLDYGSQNPEDSETFEEPKLAGTPAGLRQMVAVSDARDNEPHPFAYSWADTGDAAKMKAEMEVLAKKALAPPAKTPVKPAPSRGRRRVVAQHARKAPATLQPQLSDERFGAYQLTYASGATLVFTAQSMDAAGKKKYVTLIAQPDFNGVPQVIFTSITEDGMLDLTPKMQFVDVVDGEGNNRGDLIFELSSSHRREFAIYRVLNGQVQQVFVSGSLPLSPTEAAAKS